MAAMETPLPLFINTTTLLCTFAIAFIIYLFFPGFGSRTKEPPGPRALPLLGNFLQLYGKTTHSALYEVCKKYGPICTVYFGPKKAVVLAGYKMIKQALTNNVAFAYKEDPPIIRDLKLTHGIVFANGDIWKEMRNFALANLKQYGMGKKENEEQIIEETQFLIDAFRKNKGKAFDTSQLVNYAVANIICFFVYGKRFDYDEQAFRSMVERANTNTYLMGCPSVQLYNSCPRLFGWLGARKQLLKSAFENRKQISNVIKVLRETLNPQMCRGFVDSFLARKIELEASGKMNSHFHEDNLQISVVNLFTAGTDSTSSSIRYGLLLMAKYPEIQDRVHSELAAVIGGRQARVGDRKNLPYTDAVIHEIQRVSNVVPIIAHCATQDLTCQGYYIRKGTPVFFLLTSIHQDEDEWENAHSFNPGHFLDKQGNFRRREAFLPFSAGPRTCIGESLARMELFLFFTSLLQHFRFAPPPGVTEEELDLTQCAGITLTPKPHELRAISRH